MAPLKDDVKTIIGLVTSGLIYAGFMFIDSPLISYFFLFLWILFWATNIYGKIRYRQGRAAYILVSTVNDEYSKLTSIILGVILIILVSFFQFWTGDLAPVKVLMFVTGLLILVNGILDLPKGRIEIKGTFLSISGLANKIELKDLKTLEITGKKIVLVKTDQKVIRIDNFVIDQVSANKIIDYFRRNDNNIEIVIKNELN